MRLNQLKQTRQSLVNVLIADDEPLLLEFLEDELVDSMPELQISHRCRSGTDALNQILSGGVDIAFLDIQMPGLSGLEVAEAVIEEWPENNHNKVPIFVFITAYSHYAVEAFDLAAIDYIVKPLVKTRLLKTIERLRLRLATRVIENGLDSYSQPLIEVIASGSEKNINNNLLKTIVASVGETTYRIPINDVVLFDASDKYIEVHTADRTVLIRDTLKNLLPQLDSEKFVKIHRGAIVNLAKVLAIRKDEKQKMLLKLRGVEKEPVVSRVYRHLFQTYRP